MILPLPRKFGQLLKQVDLERYGTWSALVSALKRAGRCVFILSLSHFIHVLVRDFWRQIRTPLTKCAISRHWVLYLICSLKWIKVKKISDSTKKVYQNPSSQFRVMTSQRSSSESRLLIGPREKTRNLIG